MKKQTLAETLLILQSDLCLLLAVILFTLGSEVSSPCLHAINSRLLPHATHHHTSPSLRSHMIKPIHSPLPLRLPSDQLLRRTLSLPPLALFRRPPPPLGHHVLKLQ